MKAYHPSDKQKPLSEQRSIGTWALDHKQLEDTFNAAWSELQSDDIDEFARGFESLPQIVGSDEFPYRDTDTYASLCTKVPELLKEPRKRRAADKIACRLCSSDLPLRDIRSHVAAHILRDAREVDDPGCMLEPGIEPCGWCGRDGCRTKLSFKQKGKNSSAEIHSNCEYHYERMSYKQARQHSQSQKSTNVPLLCALCAASGQSRTIWKYNALVHVFVEHSEGGQMAILPGSMMAEIFISKAEEKSLGVGDEQTSAWRNEVGAPQSDDLPALEQANSSWSLKKRERSGTADEAQLAGQISKRLNYVPEIEEPEEEIMH